MSRKNKRILKDIQKKFFQTAKGIGNSGLANYIWDFRQ